MSGKSVLSLSVDQAVIEKIEEFQADHNFNSTSTAVNTILRTFFAEMLDKEINIPPRNAILIPKKLYKEYFDLTAYYIDQGIKKEEIKTSIILDNEYVYFAQDKEKELMLKLSEVLPIANKIDNLIFGIEQIARKMGVVIFDPYIAYSKFKATDKFTAIIEPIYAQILTKINEAYKENPLFFVSTTTEEIMGLLGKDFEGSDAKNIAMPLVEFILKEYSSGKWDNV
jgi:hypothetical protein